MGWRWGGTRLAIMAVEAITLVAVVEAITLAGAEAAQTEIKATLDNTSSGWQWSGATTLGKVGGSLTTLVAATPQQLARLATLPAIMLGWGDGWEWSGNYAGAVVRAALRGPGLGHTGRGAHAHMAEIRGVELRRELSV